MLLGFCVIVCFRYNMCMFVSGILPMFMFAYECVCVCVCVSVRARLLDMMNDSETESNLGQTHQVLAANTRLFARCP